MLMVQKVHYQPHYVAVFGILQTAHLAASECTSITDCWSPHSFSLSLVFPVLYFAHQEKVRPQDFSMQPALEYQAYQTHHLSWIIIIFLVCLQHLDKKYIRSLWRTCPSVPLSHLPSWKLFSSLRPRNPAFKLLHCSQYPLMSLGYEYT